MGPYSCDVILHSQVYSSLTYRVPSFQIVNHQHFNNVVIVHELYCFSYNITNKRSDNMLVYIVYAVIIIIEALISLDGDL